MTRSLVGDLDEIFELTDERLTALVRQTTQDMVNGANTAIAKGGRMRVDTGFLRASGKMSLTGVPSGMTRGSSDKKYRLRESTVITSLANFKLGQSIYYGWTADYAEIRELKDGFLETELQNFTRYANANMRKLAVNIR